MDQEKQNSNVAYRKYGMDAADEAGVKNTRVSQAGGVHVDPRSGSELAELYGIDTDMQRIEEKFKGAANTASNAAQDQFFSNMYNQQQMTLDTIKKNNAAAIATGASRGMQAAQQLSALYLASQDTATGATQLSQDRATMLAQAEQDALQYSNSLKDSLAGYGTNMYMQDKASETDYAVGSGQAAFDRSEKLLEAGNEEGARRSLAMDGLTEEAIDRYIDDYKQKNGIETPKSQATAQIEATTPEDLATMAKEHGVILSKDATAMNIHDVNVNSFGKFTHSGKGKGQQDNYVNSVIKAAQDGKIPNGTAIDMNYGGGAAIFVYYNGAFYRAGANVNTTVYRNGNFKQLDPTANYR